MLDNIKKYWFLYVPISIGVVWAVSVDGRIPRDAQQMVEIYNHVKNSLTPVQQAEIKLSDSLNNAHATVIRQMRYDDAKKMASIRDEREKKQDSLTLDAFKRFTVQIEKLDKKIDKHNNE